MVVGKSLTSPLSSLSMKTLVATGLFRANCSLQGVFSKVPTGSHGVPIVEHNKASGASFTMKPSDIIAVVVAPEFLLRYQTSWKQILLGLHIDSGLMKCNFCTEGSPIFTEHANGLSGLSISGGCSQL